MDAVFKLEHILSVKYLSSRSKKLQPNVDDVN